MNEGKRALYHRPPRRRQHAFAEAAERKCHRVLLVLLPASMLKVLVLHWFLPMRRQFSYLGRRSRTAADLGLSRDWALHAATLLGDVIRRTPVWRRRQCYWRSLLIFDLLARFGYPVQLHCGVKFEGQGTKTHLWTTLDDEILEDTQERCRQFTEVATFPEPE
jgi:hypothetical protein